MNEEKLLKKLELDQLSKLELFKSVIAMAALSLRSSILINGAAAISLLTFVGNGKGASKEIIVFGLFVFALGVLLGGWATLVAYLAQKNYMDQANSNKPQVDDQKHTYSAIWICGFSYLCFFVGIILAGCGILG